MAHFSKMSNDNIVEDVIVIANSDCDDLEFPASEPVGQAFIADTLLLSGTWLQTSYNGNFRGMYGGIGCLFDGTNFVLVQPPRPE
jgi:hypothetical protein